MTILQEAEDNYYITAEYVLKLANKAYDLFKSSEIEERRQLIKLVLQNPKVVEKNIVFDLQKPFDTIFKYANRSSMLPRLDSNQGPIAYKKP